MGNITELRVWKDAIELATLVYKTIGESGLSKDFGLKDQIQRSVVSIASNIAEGNDRHATKDFIRFLYIARASGAELFTQICIAKNIGLIQEQQYTTIIDTLQSIQKQINGLISGLYKRIDQP